MQKASTVKQCWTGPDAVLSIKSGVDAESLTKVDATQKQIK